MTLSEFFHALNAAGVRLAASGGRLALCPAAAITPELRAGAAEHKPALLALLNPTPCGGVAQVSGDESEAEVAAAERASIAAEGNGEVSGVEAAKACEGWDLAVAEDGFRHDHDWRDWRLEWLLEVGKLFLRTRDCRDPA